MGGYGPKLGKRPFPLKPKGAVPKHASRTPSPKMKGKGGKMREGSLEKELKQKLANLKQKAREQDMTLVLTRLEELESLLYLGFPAPRVWGKVRLVETMHFDD